MTLTLKINEKPQMRRVGYLFQNYALFPNMSVEGKYCGRFKRTGSKTGHWRQKAFCTVTGSNQGKSREMIERFRLAGLEKRYPGQLSGGQQQRVALARILAYEPKYCSLMSPFLLWIHICVKVSV